MEALILAFIFIFGVLIGSFLNVLIYRHNTGMTLGGRSMCFSCGKKLHWHELIPVLSFFMQKKRCRGCGSKIAWQYSLVELATGALFTGIAFKILFPVTLISIIQTIILFKIISVLMVIFVYDMRHKIIPDLYAILFTLLAIAYTAFNAFALGEPVTHALLFNAGAGLLLFLFFAGLWYFSGGRAMGFGDAKLAVGIGLLLGMGKGLLAIMISFWVGALYGVFLLLARKKYVTMKTEIPFAPFMILGLIISFCLDKNIFDVFIF
jgi:prepilin signal peptidase PulO-like enzyme (type II secretory pathway)